MGCVCHRDFRAARSTSAEQVEVQSDMIQTTVTTMTGLRLALLSSMILTTLLLPGCSKQDDSKGRKSQMAESGMAADVSSVSVDDIQPDATSYDCTSVAGSADKRSWCLGLQAWNDSEYQPDDRARDEFIEGWRLGSLDAQQAVNPGIEQLQSRPAAAAGYESGYINVLDAIGVIEYECSEGAETDNEYRDRWCEAAAAFNRPFGLANQCGFAGHLYQWLYVGSSHCSDLADLHGIPVWR